MRLVLPCGEDGAPRSYPLDDALSGSVTLTETLELLRVTGVSLPDLYDGVSHISEHLDPDRPRSLAVILSGDVALMRSFLALVWLLRYRAGDRADDGTPLSFEAAGAMPITGIVFAYDPGDEVPEDGEPADPPKPSAGGGRATAGGKSKAHARTGRSSKTSGGKS